VHAQRHTVALTTDASGDCTAYSPSVAGRVLAVIYTKNNFDNGVDITVSTNTTLQTIVTLTDINASAVKYPRVPVHDEAGVAATLDGTRAMREPVTAAGEEIKIVVAQGGNAKLGSITLIVG
jgi:hypothetical protein